MDRRKRMLVELVLGASSLALAVLTAIWHGWIEGIFGADPDRGSGSLEWAVVIGLAGGALLLLAIARVEWRRTIATHLAEGPDVQETPV